MTNQNDGREIICARLQELGFAAKKHIKLYGEEFEIVSNPVPDGEGFAVEGVGRISGSLRRMRIPLSLIQTLKKERAFNTPPEVAA
jgi:hypothetical protein